MQSETKGRSVERCCSTRSIDSMMKLGRLKKNLDRSKIDNVARSFRAFEALSSTGRKIWLAFCPPSRMEIIIGKKALKTMETYV